MTWNSINYFLNFLNSNLHNLLVFCRESLLCENCICLLIEFDFYIFVPWWYFNNKNSNFRICRNLLLVEFVNQNLFEISTLWQNLEWIFVGSRVWMAKFFEVTLSGVSKLIIWWIISKTISIWWINFLKINYSNESSPNGWYKEWYDWVILLHWINQ